MRYIEQYSITYCVSDTDWRTTKYFHSRQSADTVLSKLIGAGLFAILLTHKYELPEIPILKVEKTLVPNPATMRGVYGAI